MIYVQREIVEGGAGTEIESSAVTEVLLRYIVGSFSEIYYHFSFTISQAKTKCNFGIYPSEVVVWFIFSFHLMPA